MPPPSINAGTDVGPVTVNLQVVQMTPAQVRQAVDDKLAALWSAIQARQTAYMAANNGRAWQGLRTHSATPADGVESAPDVGTATPTNLIGQSWPAAIRTASMPMTLQVDCYEAPSGHGYVATVEVAINGNTWRRAAQSGPEVWRAYPWTQVAVTP